MIRKCSHFECKYEEDCDFERLHTCFECNYYLDCSYCIRGCENEKLLNLFLDEISRSAVDNFCTLSFSTVSPLHCFVVKNTQFLNKAGFQVSFVYGGPVVVSWSCIPKEKFSWHLGKFRMYYFMSKKK